MLSRRDITRTDDGMSIRVRHGKGDRHRVVAIGSDIAGYIDAWIAVWERNYTLAKTLFCTVKGKGGRKLSPVTARSLIKRLAKRCGLEKRVHVHGLRHTFALELDNEGQPLRVIQQSLGHKNAATTSTYLSALGGGEAVAAMMQRQAPQDPRSVAAQALALVRAKRSPPISSS